MDALREEVDTDPVNHSDEFPFSIRNAAGETQYTYELKTALARVEHV
jgi:hypothetical protein